jgi:hypothetical protein
MRTPIVYLCGGINGLSDADAKDWRELAKLRLPHTLDPMRRDYRGVEHSFVHEIVCGDYKDIRDSNCVLAMCVRPSWGTAMEIHEAHGTGRIVFAVVESLKRVSPWLIYHCGGGLFTSLDAAIDAIEDLFR